MGEHPQWLSTVGGQCCRYLRKPGNWYQKANLSRTFLQNTIKACRKKIIALCSKCKVFYDFFWKVRDKNRKKNIILGTMTLMLGIGLFFYCFSEKEAYAKGAVSPKKEIVKAEELDPLSRIGRGQKIGGEAAVSKICLEDKTIKSAPVKKPEVRNQKFLELVVGHPIEKMLPYIEKRDRQVAAYLIAIARKESSWGKHTPKKDGRECFNYWGYRGKENATASGYSCFDSEEHAVKVVGDRIEKLIDQQINTPAKMVVWKCGRNCEAAGGQAAANKWIADVAHIYGQLGSS